MKTSIAIHTSQLHGFNTTHSSSYQSPAWTQLSDCLFRFLTLIILLKTIHSFGVSIVKRTVICLFTVKWFQVLLSNANNFICTQLNGFMGSIEHKKFYSTLFICLHTVEWFQVLLYNAYNSI